MWNFDVHAQDTKKMNKKAILALIFFFFLSKSDLDFHKNDEIDSQLREQ